ncbi:unnamed protein product [Calicophoron daubneyi]|uniref:Amidase domain-containing protein n=1 Tax=Calicophoron daubneyi TaxID=300641 RepID=A0AAV2TMN7_CALDB
MKPVKDVIYTVLDTLSLIYFFDYFTFSLTSICVYNTIGAALHLHQWRLFRWIFTTYIFYRIGLFTWHRYRVQNKLRKKQDDVIEKHGRLNEKLKATEDPKISAETISKMSIADLRELILSKRVSTVDVVDAYQRRALELYRRVPGCISELVFDADVYAILADSALGSEDKSHLTPLHGIPISLQEVFPVRGFDHTMGYTVMTGKPAENDCLFVEALRDAGAIPLLLTNVKQNAFGFKSENPIFGHTAHPTHPGRACISGDGALLLCGGTPLSFGADMIGSPRLCAAFCGLMSFKPTTGRMTQRGLDLPINLPRALGIIPTPIGRTVGSLADAFRTLWTPAMFNKDTTLCALPFDEDKYKSGSKTPMKVGYYTGIEKLMPVSPAVERVMSEVKSHLINLGHEVIEFTLPEPDRAYRLIISLLASTLAPGALRLIYRRGHSDVISDYRQRALHLFYALPTFLKKIVCEWRSSEIRKDYPVSALAVQALACTKSYADLECEADEYMKIFYDKWNDEEIDCLVCPVSPIPAPLEDASFDVVNSVLLFTSLFNLVGCPAGTLSMGRVEKLDIEITSEAGDNVKVNKMFIDQMRGSEGLPIGIQVVGKPWNDEVALGLMKSLASVQKS